MRNLRLTLLRFKKFFRNHWQEFILLIVVLMIGLPSLFVEWMIVDDGASILIAQKISGFLSGFNFVELWNLFVEKDPGRFRPGYWLFQWVTYLLAGKSPLLHHLIHFLISGGTVFLIYSIIRILTSSKSAALVGGLLFSLVSFNVENWYRLGPVEPIVTFYIALSLYFLIKNFSLVKDAKKEVPNRYLLFSALPLVPAYFTKETFFVFLPFAVFLIPGAFFIKNQTRRKHWLRRAGYFLLANLILTLISLMFVVFVRKQGYYSSFYTVSLPLLIGHAKGYLGIILKSFGFFSWIFSFSFLAFSLVAIKKREFTLNQFFQLAFIFGFLSFLAIQLPWAFVLGRYLEPALLFLVIVCGFEANRIFNLALSNSKLKTRLIFWNTEIKFSLPFSSLRNFVFSLAFLWLILVNGPSIFNYTSDVIRGHKKIKELLLFVANEAPKNGRVFFNLKKGDATIELVFEGGLHLNLFYDRPDLTIDYLDEDKLKVLKSGDFIVTAIASEQFSAYRKEDLKKIKTLKTVKTVQHKIAPFFLNTSFFTQALRSFLYGTPYPSFYRFSTQESQWRVDKII